ncbi:MAG: hypothetical protein HQ515_20000 [Phycisphaeraceae bacterium]|nr:hypothetical protein [Phycisphaeraceae bacterium]
MCQIKSRTRRLTIRRVIIGAVVSVLACSSLYAQPGGGGGFIVPPGEPPQTFKMHTVVRDSVTTEWTLQCPDGEVLDISTVSLTDKGMQAFFECLGQIESQQGIHISSHTVVKDFVVESDEILSRVEMTADQVNKLKTIIDNHQIPMMPFPLTRPRVESVLLDGELDSFVIDLGDGCLLDLTDPSIGPQVLDPLIQLLQQFESENGVSVTSATTVKDGQIEKDRVIQITTLLPHQIEQILQFLHSRGFAVLFGQKLAPMSMQGVIDFNGERIEFDVRGDMLLQPMPPDPESGALPFEIQDLQLVSPDPLGLSVGLSPPQQPMPLFLHPVDPTGRLMQLEGHIPNLVFNQVGPDQATLLAHPEFPFDFDLFGCGPWPFLQPMCIHSLGLKHLLTQGMPNLPGQPRPGSLMIQDLVLDLPLRIPVVPDGGVGFPGNNGQ